MPLGGGGGANHSVPVGSANGKKASDRFDTNTVPEKYKENFSLKFSLYFSGSCIPISPKLSYMLCSPYKCFCL
jgi:hypothetical protein